MSKTVKRKFTVELPKPRDLSINRLSVFQRLGTKKLKAAESAASDGQKPPNSSAATPSSTTPPQTSTSSIVTASTTPTIVPPPTLPISSAFATAAKLAAKIIDTKQQQQQLLQQQQQNHHLHLQHHTPPQTTPSSFTTTSIKAAVIHDPVVVTLDDADPDLLERKRAELQKELELQLKMETSAASRSAKIIGSNSAKDHHNLAATMRKRKKLPSSSSSSSSSSDSSSSDSSSSSSSKDRGGRRKMKKPSSSKAMMTKRGGHRGSSSSPSSEPHPHRVKKLKSKRVCHKKLAADPNKLHKSGHGSNKKLVAVSSSSQKMRKRSQSPSMTRKRMAVGSSPNRMSHKMSMKSGKISSSGEILISSKHQHRVKEMQMMRSTGGDKDRGGGEPMQHQHQRDRERMRSRERGRSRTPKFRQKSRSPKRLSPPPSSSRSREMMQMQHKSPPLRGRLTPTKQQRIGMSAGSSSMSGLQRRERPSPERSMSNSSKKDMKRYANSRERERERLRDKERREREHEAAREKEREEILARCQERQRERERLARDKLRREREREEERTGKTERLLPRPAERAMALAAAHDRSRDKSMERNDRAPRSHSQLVRDRMDREKDHLGGSYERSGVSGGYERDDLRYHEHGHLDRRLEKDDRGVILDDRDRDYMMVRRRDDSPYINRVIDKRMDRDIIDRDMYGATVVDQRYDDHLRDDRRGDPHSHDYGVPVPGSGRSSVNAIDRGGGGGGGYIDDRHRVDRERDWIRESDHSHRDPVDRSVIYDHPVDRHPITGGGGGARDWDRADIGVPQVRDNYADTREWGNMPPDHGHGQWDTTAAVVGGGNAAGNWPQEEETENWDHHADDKEWQDYHRGGPDKMRHENVGANIGGGIGQHQNSGGIVGGNANVGGNNQNRRWNNWRGRRGNQHHGGGNDYRRHNNMHQQVQQDPQQQQQPYPSRAELTFNRRHQLQNKIVEPLLSLPTVLPAVTPVPINEFRPVIIAPQPLMNVVTKPDNQSISITHPQLKVVPVTPAAASTTSEPIVAESKEIAGNTAVVAEIPPKENIGGNTIEEILDEDNLSEISDEADEILNLPEDDSQVSKTNASLLSLLTASKSSISTQKITSTSVTSGNILDDVGDPYECGSYFRPDYEPELQEKSADNTAESAAEAESTQISQPSDSVQTNASDDNATVDEITQPTAVESIPPTSLDTQSTSEDTERPVMPTKPLIDTPQESTTKDITDEMDLDFEEISDGELEEEARIRGLGDALGVDWASLVEESRAIAREKSNVRNTSAKQRWEPHRILLDVGISLKMAGTKFATDMLNDVYAKLEQEEMEAKRFDNETEDKKKIKTEIGLTADGEKMALSDIVKKEKNDEDDNEQQSEEKDNVKAIDVKSIKTEPDTKIDMARHPIACIQVAHRANAEKRRGLVINATGTYSRALSARRDLKMRRQLCGLSVRSIDKCLPNETSTVSQKEANYRNIALEMFQKTLGKAR